MASVRATLYIIDESKEETNRALCKNDGLLSSRVNSFFRRTTTRAIPLVTSGSAARSDLRNDFLNLLTAVEDLYSQPNVLKMQQINNATKRNVGAGAVFQVSYIEMESTKLSDVAADNIVKQKKPIILKRSPVQMFKGNGETLDSKASQQAAARFIMELRILSQPYVRSHGNIVDLLGIGWEYNGLLGTCPEPSLVLEQAYGTLDEFQESNPSLPFHTRSDICLDIAKGLQALHKCGIVHGDVKLENVLMFEKERWIAKVADFSHSLLNTEDDQYLVGGTAVYAAPEWKQKLSPLNLTKTDVYSFGFVVASVMIGFDIAGRFIEQLENGRTTEERFQNLTILKETDELRNYVIGLMQGVHDTELASRADDPPLLEDLANLTLQLDPSKRDLNKMMLKISNYKENVYEELPTKVMERLNSNILSIPYHSMNSMSFLLKAQVVRSLECVAEKDVDERASAACYDLALCFFSGFGTDMNFSTATKWLIKGCEKGEFWARATIHRLVEAMDQSLPNTTPVDEWLSDAASRGSRTALESLLKLSPASYNRVRKTFRSEFSNAFLWELDENRLFTRDFTDISFYTNFYSPQKDTILHWAAMTGRDDVFTKIPESLLADMDILNFRNSEGDTPLIYACKSGRHQVVQILLKLGANVKISNNNHENCLHFLSCFEEKEAGQIAGALFDAGADVTQEATSLTMNRPLDIRPIVPGCPLVRATTSNKPFILKILLKLEKEHQGQLTRGQAAVRRANLRKLIAWACRLSDIDTLEVIYNHEPKIFSHESINNMGFWSEGRRYSLAALVIIGCVSDKPASGFNMPERFWRALSYGRDYQQNLRRTLAFLSKLGFDFVQNKCGGERNALFLAIREGKFDALQFLLEQPEIGTPFRAFGWKGDEGRYNEQVANAPHRLKTGLVKAIKLAIVQGYRDIFRILLQLHNGEALNRGPRFQVFLRRGKTEVNTSQTSKPPTTHDRQHALEPHTGDDDNGENATNNDQNDEIAGQGCPSISAARKANDVGCFYPLTKSVHTICYRRIYPSDFAYRFPVNFHSASRWFDGRINYGLLYMNFVAMADHRDILFGSILLEELDKHGISEHQDWIPNQLEQTCYPELFTPPLIRSTLIQWNELTRLLLLRRANPRAKYYWSDSLVWRKRSRESTYVQLLRMKELKAARSLIEATGLAHTAPKLLFGRKELSILTTLEGQASSHLADASELWASCVEQHVKANRKLKDSFLGFVLLAARYQSDIAIEHLLQMGLSANGKWLISIFITPLDVAVSSKTAQAKSCKRILNNHGAHRGGILCLAEVHVFCNILAFALLALGIWSVIRIGSLGNSWFASYARSTTRIIQDGNTSGFILFLAFVFIGFLFYLPVVLVALLSMIAFGFLIISPLANKCWFMCISPVSFLVLNYVFSNNGIAFANYLRGPLWHILRPVFIRLYRERNSSFWSQILSFFGLTTSSRRNSGQASQEPSGARESGNTGHDDIELNGDAGSDMV